VIGKIKRVMSAMTSVPAVLAQHADVHERQLLLAGRQAAAVPCALVTMSWRRLADAAIAAAPDGSFTTSVTGDEVARGKPHPDPYLAAAAALGVAPERCVAIEDSPTGVASALAAGCATLGVPHVVPLESATGLTIVDSLVGIELGQLERLDRPA